MDELIGCPHCRRHARSTERACPFCGGSLEGAVPGVVNGMTRRALTRGAIVLGAAALAGACGGSEERVDEGGGGGTSGGDEGDRLAADAGDPLGVDAGTDAGSAAAGEGELVDPDERRWRHRPPCDPGDMACMSMPYGAPALPDAIV